MKIKLTNEAHIQYARTDDACQAFRKAITNGQSRLALEMMVDIVDFVESLSERFGQAEEPAVSSEEDVIRHEEKEEPKPAPAKKAAKKAAPKQTPKEEESTPEED